MQITTLQAAIIAHSDFYNVGRARCLDILTRMLMAEFGEDSPEQAEVTLNTNEQFLFGFLTALSNGTEEIKQLSCDRGNTARIWSGMLVAYNKFFKAIFGENVLQQANAVLVRLAT